MRDASRGMPDFETDLAANRARVRAVPMFWDGPIPPERDRRVEDDDKSFSEVLLLFLRSWPYIRPQFLGRWLIPGQGIEPQVAETVSGGGYQFTYAPFLVGAIALAGPLFGAVPATMAWPMSLLYPPIAALVLSMFALAFTTGRRQMVATIALVLSGARHQHLRDLLHRRLRGQLLRRRRHHRRHRRLDVPVPRRPRADPGADPGGHAPRLLLCHQLHPAFHCADARGDPRRSPEPEHPAERAHRAGACGPLRDPGVGPGRNRRVVRRPAPRTRVALREARPRRAPRATAAAGSSIPTTTCGSCSGSTRICGSRSSNVGTSCRSATTANTAQATRSSASTRTARR